MIWSATDTIKQSRYFEITKSQQVIKCGRGVVVKSDEGQRA